MVQSICLTQGLLGIQNLNEYLEMKSSFFFCLCSAVKGEEILICSVMTVELCLLPEYIAFLLSQTGINILPSDISERNP